MAADTGEDADQAHRVPELQTRRGDILRAISDVDFKQRYVDIKRRRIQGTGTWIFEIPEFKKWLNGSTSYLWCHGDPGVGKTFLASTVLDHILSEPQPKDDGSKSVAAAYVYCQQAQKTEQTALALFTNILRQFVEQDPSFENGSLLSIAADFFERYKDKQVEFRDYNNFFPDSRYRRFPFNKKFVLIDGLDACLEVEALCHMLYYVLPPDTKFFIMSRDVPTIRKALPMAAKIEVKSHPKDVQVYVHSRIRNNSSLRAFTREKPSLEEQILSTVQGKYSYVFLMVRLLMDNLADLGHVDEVNDALRNLPTNREGFYSLAVNRIKNHDFAMRVLAWVLHAKRPLQMNELQHALSIPQLHYPTSRNDERSMTRESLLNYCPGLITSQSESNGEIIVLSHSTVKEYLDALDTNGELFPFKAEFMIACSCITYLLYNVFSSDARSEDSFSERIRKYPFLQYAARYNESHARASIQPMSHHLTLDSKEQEILETLETRLVEKYGNLQSAIQARNQNRHTLADDRLIYATRFGLYNTTSKLLEQSPIEMSAKDENGRTALHWAAIYGYTQIGKQLLKSGFDIEAPCDRGLTALHLAVTNGRKEFVDMLIESGTDLTVMSSEGKNALHLAAESGNKLIVQILLEKGANLNSTSKSEEDPKMTALHLAAKSGHMETVAHLVRSGSNIEQRSGNDDTALELAAANGHTKTAKLLIDLGANTLAINNSGSTPLHAAAEFGDKELVELLLDRGADITASRFYVASGTPLMVAAENGHVEIMKILLDHGADIEAKLESGETSLLWAAFSGYLEAVKLLLSRGATVSDDAIVRTLSGPYRYPATSVEMMKVLLAARQGRRLSNKVVIAAVEMGDEDIILFLVDHSRRSLEDWLLKAARHSFGPGIEVLMRRAAEDNICITEEMIKKAVQNPWERSLKCLLEYRQDIKIIPGILKSALRSGRSDVLKILFDHDKDIYLTKDLLEFGISHASNGKAAEFLINYYKRDGINSSVIAMIARNHVPDVMELIIARGNKIQVTEELLKAASKNAIFGGDMLKLLLDRNLDPDLKVSANVVETAAKSEYVDADTLKSILEYAGPEVQITQNILISAVRSTGDAGSIARVETFLDRTSDVAITEAVLTAAARNRFCGEKLLEMLLDRSPRVQITEAVMKAAARNELEAGRIFEMMLTRYPAIMITKPIVRAAMTNGQDGENLFTVLMDHGCTVEVTKDAVEKAAKSGWVSPLQDLLKLLLENRGRLKITQEAEELAQKIINDEISFDYESDSDGEERRRTDDEDRSDREQDSETDEDWETEEDNEDDEDGCEGDKTPKASTSEE